MSVFSRLRVYHAALGFLAIAAYLTEDLKGVHVWLGYSLAGLIVARIALAIIAPRVLTSPHWLIRVRDLSLAKGLQSPVIGKSVLAAIMACMLVTIASGIVMDQKLTAPGVVTSALADDDRSGRKRDKPDKFVKEIHEVAANALFLFVALHIAYLLMLRRRYALSMMFIGSPAPQSREDRRSALHR